MISKIPKFNPEDELLYRHKFSAARYKLFLLVEKIYKFFINDDDQRLDIILRFIKESRAINILEIGSGTLPIYKFIPENYKKFCAYYICEVNQKKAEQLALAHKSIKVVCADALNLPFPDNSFDLVFSKGVLHHVDAVDMKIRHQKRIKFLAESRRILKNEGQCLLMDFDYNSKRFKDYSWHQLHKVLLTEGEHNFSNKSEAEIFFKEAGFKRLRSGEFDTFKGLYYYIIGEKNEDDNRK